MRITARLDRPLPRLRLPILRDRVRAAEPAPDRPSDRDTGLSPARALPPIDLEPLAP